MSIGKKVPVTKGRVIKICNAINSGQGLAKAAAKEGLGGPYVFALQESGIVYKDADGIWRAKTRIHDARYADFLKLRSEYSKKVDARLKSKPETDVTDTVKVVTEVKPKDKPVIKRKRKVKLGFWQKLKIKLFGK
jgi:hypothetical protein